MALAAVRFSKLPTREHSVELDSLDLATLIPVALRLIGSLPQVLQTSGAKLLLRVSPTSQI